MILPEVAAGARADLDPLRDACAAAIGQVVCAGADEVVVIGAGERTRSVGVRAAGTMAPFGIDARAGWGTGPDAEPLPLSLTVGARLLERAGCRLPVRGLVVGHDTAAPECARLGRELVGVATGLLVMGDGSARRESEAPGYFDPRSVPFDRNVVELLRTSDTEGLLGLDAGLAAELLVAGRPAWQVAAGAVTAPMRGRVLCEEAPYGVGYVVAVWERP